RRDRSRLLRERRRRPARERDHEREPRSHLHAPPPASSSHDASGLPPGCTTAWPEQSRVTSSRQSSLHESAPCAKPKFSQLTAPSWSPSQRSPTCSSITPLPHSLRSTSQSGSLSSQ